MNPQYRDFIYFMNLIQFNEISKVKRNLRPVIELMNDLPTVMLCIKMNFLFLEIMSSSQSKAEIFYTRTFSSHSWFWVFEPMTSSSESSRRICISMFTFCMKVISSNVKMFWLRGHLRIPLNKKFFRRFHVHHNCLILLHSSTKAIRWYCF